MQKPLAQSPTALQTAPCGCPTQKPALQMPVRQSPGSAQRLPFPHGGQGPPQSTSVSPRSCNPSRQCEAHTPPTHTCPDVQRARGSGPLTTLPQSPSTAAPAAREQARQGVPVQAALQQTPSVQWPEAHCPSWLQPLPSVASATQRPASWSQVGVAPPQALLLWAEHCPQEPSGRQAGLPATPAQSPSPPQAAQLPEAVLQTGVLPVQAEVSAAVHCTQTPSARQIGVADGQSALERH